MCSMRNYAVSDGVFHKASVSKIFAFVSLKCYVTQFEDVICE